MSCERVLTHALAVGDEPQGIWHLHLDPLPRVVATARSFVAEHAPPLPVETNDALLLLTSELVTNAVLHARTPLEVGVVVAEQSVVVSVHDLDLSRPEQQPYAKREGGWGLKLVAALAEAGALEPHPDGGKTAWFRLHRGELPGLGDAVASRAQTSRLDGGGSV